LKSVVYEIAAIVSMEDMNREWWIHTLFGTYAGGF
jgi:hypothetical protein